MAAKFIRVEDLYDSTKFTNAFFTLAKVNPEIDTFPVINVDAMYDGLSYEIQINGAWDPALSLDYTDLYVTVVDGTGSGQIRKVVEFTFASGEEKITFKVQSAFRTELSDVSGDTRSWVKFTRISRTYAGDHWPCKSFIDNINGLEIDFPELYSSEDSILNRIADFGFTVGNTGYNNQLDIDGQQYTDNIDNLESINIVPISNLYASVETRTFSMWEYGTENWWNTTSYPKIADGLYGQVDHVSGAFTNGFNSYDRDSTTYAAFDLTFNQDSSIGLFFKIMNFDIPAQPDFAWDKLYIGIKLNTKCNRASAITVGESSFRIMLRTWGGFKRYTILNTKVANENFATGCDISCLPDRYWVDVVDTNDFAYYRESAITGSAYDTITGLTYFEVNGITRENYNALALGGLFFFRSVYFGTSGTDTMKLYELAFVFQKESSTIKDAVYTPVAGRIFNDTFNGRKTNTDLMEKPNELFEHFSRLQDYRDTSYTPPSGWGLQYASSPLIATRGFGSFDALSINQQAAAQFTEYDFGFTDVIKQSLCRNFALANWQDADGYERLLALPTYAIAPVYTITLSDITDRNKIKILEANQNEIYSEPFVRYNKNNITGEYEGILSISNSSATYFNNAYVDGIQNQNEAQELWQACHTLALKAHRTGKPPIDLTDLQWANGPGGYSIALSYLQKWVAWQSATEIELPLHFNVAGSWQECTPINIVFSHQTNNIVRHALVESSVVNPNHPYDVMLKAIMYA
jgi:hypothetical protein